MEPSIACAKAGVTTGEWGATLRARVRRIPRADGRVAGRRAPSSDDGLERGARRGRARVGAARPAHQAAGRQARPRRPLQRRRADRGARARLRHGGGLRGHPPDAGADRARRGATRRVHVVGLSILSGSHVPLVERGDAAHAQGGPRRRAGGGRRHHPARGRREARRASASPPSTRPRTSSSTPSCATSCGWWTGGER